MVVVFYLWATNFFTSIIILFNDRSIATFCAPKTNLDKLAQILFFQTLQLFWYMYQQSLPLSLSLVPGGKLKFGAVQWTYLQEWNFWNILNVVPAYTIWLYLNLCFRAPDIGIVVGWNLYSLGHCTSHVLSACHRCILSFNWL